MKEKWKLRIAFMLVIIICITAIPFSMFPSRAMAATPTDGTRYTVLVLDVSGSMSGTPLKVAKQAAKKFCSSMMASEGRNYIAIVSYGTKAVIKCDFSMDLTQINNTIDNLSSTGNTNTNDGLIKAENLINEVPSNAVKNIVLLSDGQPQQGATSVTGPYTSSDNSYYKYGNAVYETAKALKEKCNIYTLGFFHASSGKNLTFGKKLLEDIQNSGYFNVEDIDKLEFVFGEIADKITKGTLKKLFIQQHKQYFNSAQFKKDIIEGYSNYLLDIAIEDSGNATITAYNTLDTLNKFLGSDTFGYQDEYEFILAQLMMSENNYKGLQENFAVNFIGSLGDIGAFAIDFVSDIVEKMNKAEDKADLSRMKELFNKMQSLDWKSTEYNNAYKEYKTLVNKHMSASEMQKALSTKYEIASSATTVLANTASDIIEYIAYGEAYKKVSDDYKTILLLMYYQVEQNVFDVEEEGLRFIESLIQYEYLMRAISSFLSGMEAYKEDEAEAIKQFVGKSFSEETMKEATDVLVTKILEAIPCFKKYDILKEVLEKGQNLLDITTGIDQYAYAGNMVGRLYYFSKIMYDVVLQCGDSLNATKEEENLDTAFTVATVFDEAIHLYKATIGIASDYAIRLEERSLEKELEKNDTLLLKPNKKKVSWHSTAITLATTQKLIINEVTCHNEAIMYEHVKKTITYDDNNLKIFTVACPVSMTVKDALGTQIAYLSDTSQMIMAGYEQYFKVKKVGEEYVKIALVPKDYNITIKGTGTGFMDTYIASFHDNEIIEQQVFEDIPVTSNTTAVFDKREDSKYDFIVDGEKQLESIENTTTDEEEKQPENTEDLTNDDYSITKNGITITLDKPSYTCKEGESFVVQAEIEVPESYQSGSHKYIGYFAYLKNGKWEQVSSWYIDGGTIIYPIKMTIKDWETIGQTLFVVSVFPIDNFATGGSLCDSVFIVNVEKDTNLGNNNKEEDTNNNTSNNKDEEDRDDDTSNNKDEEDRDDDTSNNKDEEDRGDDTSNNKDEEENNEDNDKEKGFINGQTAINNAETFLLNSDYVTKIDGKGVNHWYKFNTTKEEAYYFLETKNIDVKTHSWSYELKAEVCNEFGEVIFGNNHILSSDARVSNCKLEPNTTYYLRICDNWNEGAGNFKFKITSKVDLDENNRENATPIELSEKYDRTLDGSGDRDWFTFYTDEAENYVLYGKNIDIQTHTWASEYYFRITLLNSVREEVTQLRLREGASEKVVVQLEPNTKYYIRIENHFEGDLYNKENGYLFSIGKPEITSDNVTIATNSYIYNGKKKKPKVTVFYDGKELISGVDYKVNYKNNKNAGKATVIITGTGSYIGTVKKHFIIEKATQKIKVKNNSYTKTLGSKPFTISASAKGNISFTSSNKKIASVNAKGVVTLKKAGKVKITVKAAKTSNYKAASKTIVITVKAKK